MDKPRTDWTDYLVSSYFQAVQPHWQAFLANRQATIVFPPSRKVRKLVESETIPPAALFPGQPPARSRTFEYSGPAFEAARANEPVQMFAPAAKLDLSTRPDQLTLELLPQKGTPWRTIVEAARYLKEIIGELGLQVFVKSAFRHHLHLVAPIRRTSHWVELRLFARALAQIANQQAPQLFATSFRGRANGRVVLNAGLNEPGYLTIAPYSLRLPSHDQVCLPLAWDELETRYELPAFTLEYALRRVSRIEANPWEWFHQVNQGLRRDWPDRLENLFRSPAGLSPSILADVSSELTAGATFDSNR